MKKFSQKLLLTTLAAGSCICFISPVFAEKPLASFSLDPMVITAQRTEKRELETPATTKIITAEEIERKGFVSVFDALEQTIGIQSYSYTSGQGDNGSSTGRINMRGMDKGTLILVNGAPINLNNYNSTSGIPLSAVEKIEVIKGSNSVLYGSDAMAGVINIITKKSAEQKSRITTNAGNIYRSWEAVSGGSGYNISFGREYFDEFRNSAVKYQPYSTNRRKYLKDNLFASFTPAKNFTLNYMHTETKNTGMFYLKPNGKAAKTAYSYHDKRDNISLIYDNKDTNLKSNLSFNRRRIDGKQYSTKGVISRSGASSNIVLYSVNFDNNKKWNLSDSSSLLAGFTVNKEKYEEIIDRSHAIDRDSLGVYLSYDKKYNDKFSSVLGLRGHFVKGNGWDNSHNSYLPQLQTLYKINENTTWYTNFGKAFEMPAINSKFSRSKTGSVGALEPQEGWTYETGFKRITDSASAKLALFSMKMNNKFAWRTYQQLNLTPPLGIDPSTYIQVNLGEFKNTGIELEYSKNLSDMWRYNLGFTYQNPKAKDAEIWEQQSARIQFTSGASYNIGKFGANLNLFYSGDRENSSYGKLHKLKPSLRANGVLTYTPDNNQYFRLNFYNLLDRENVINVNEHLEHPFNWSVSYTYNF